MDDFLVRLCGIDCVIVQDQFPHTAISKCFLCVTVSAAGVGSDYMNPFITMLASNSKLDGTARATCCCSTEVTTQPVLFTAAAAATDTNPSTLCLAGPAQILSDGSITQALSAGTLGVSASSLPVEGQLPVCSTTAPATTAVYLEPKQEPTEEVMSVMPGGDMSLGGGDMISVLPGSDVLTVGPGLMQSLMLCQAQGGCPAEVSEVLQQVPAQHISPATVNTALQQVTPVVAVDAPASSSQGSDAGTEMASAGLEPAAAAKLPSDGTLTSAIQSGIPITINPSSLTGPVAINQVFVPIYSNTDKGPIIELVPIKANPAPAPTPPLLPQVTQ